MTTMISGSFNVTRMTPTPTVAWARSPNTTSLGASYDTNEPGGPSFRFLFGMSFPGMPAVGTYDQATPGLTCLVDIANRISSTNWTASAGGIDNPGTCSITFTSVTPISETWEQTRYCVHGSLRSTAPDAFGAPSTVTLTASF